MLSRSVASKKVPARSVNHLGWVLSHPNLSSTSKVLYALLWNRLNEIGGRTIAVPSSELAQMLGISADRVSRVAGELRDTELISTRQQGGGRPLEFTLLSIVGLVAAVAASHGVHAVAEGAAGSVYFTTFDADSSAERDAQIGGGENAGAAASSPVENPPLGFPTPFPAREYLNSTSATGAPARELTADEVVLLQKLIDHGVHEPVARRRVELLPGRVAMQLESLPFRSNVTDKAAFLVAAIDRNLPPAKRAVKYREEQARRAAEKPKISPEEQRVIKVQAERATEAMIAALPFDVRYVIEQRAKQFVETGVFARLPATAKRDLERYKIVQFAEEYVCPLQQPVAS